MAATKDDPTILGSHHNRIFDIHNSWRHPTKTEGDKIEKIKQDPNFSEIRVVKEKPRSRKRRSIDENLGIEQES
jgi:hypothetical protein